ncbi:adenylate/guanylate cyclase domain-containing protein [Bradyrhizobium jicamae]|uniref:adenylate/guanylate cyclase domain-containing protein n=1 Tax=Bradyrhizobium jicamae TaxID=280332 RepID=UPI001BA6B40B|nr:adenylate/guanylate cyclase domain-containing protein [Bradyrhizobium jicamae]MBR0934335.1 adenylate/guanylate cyclase domain-containing protein [Bradyrhizobium jicamae]
MVPEIRYAKSGGVHIAYQVFGSGPVDLVIIPGFISNIEHYWDWPEAANWLSYLAGRARVIIFDKRGTGLSDRLGQLPSLEQRMEDARAVMDAVGVRRAAVMGFSEGGSLAVLLAAVHPERCSALVLYGAFARFSDWFPTKQKFEAFLNYVETSWGTGESFAAFAPSKKDNVEFKKWWGRWERLGGSPSAVASLMRLNSGINIDGILPTLRVPTLVLHRTEDPTVSIQAGRFLAKNVPHAALVELEGADHMCWFGENAMQIADTILDFIVTPGGDTRNTVSSRRVLATILFTDIVGSTERAHKLGDRSWRELLQAHDATVRREILRFRGNEVKSTGDGFLAEFDGPARAIRCAVAITEAMAPLGIHVRAGLHAGEVERSDTDVHGIAVHLAARIMDTAPPGGVVVSRTVKDLIAGSGIELEAAGEHILKGLQEKWELFRVKSVA